MSTHHVGEHIATLNGPSGAGILFVPSYGNSDHIGARSNDWDTIMRDLHRMGWTPLTDDWDLPIVLARLSNGGTILGLQADDSHARASDADFDAAVLHLLAGAAG